MPSMTSLVIVIRNFVHVDTHIFSFNIDFQRSPERFDHSLRKEPLMTIPENWATIDQHQALILDQRAAIQMHHSNPNNSKVLFNESSNHSGLHLAHGGQNLGPSVPGPTKSVMSHSTIEESEDSNDSDSDSNSESNDESMSSESGSGSGSGSCCSTCSDDGEENSSDSDEDKSDSSCTSSVSNADPTSKKHSTSSKQNNILKAFRITFTCFGLAWPKCHFPTM